MKEKWRIPYLDNHVVCIVDIGNPVLAAQLSSLFARDNHYFPLYIFPNVSTMSDEIAHDETDGFLSNLIGENTAVFINNSIAKMGCETYVFAGLSEYQKSYLTKYIKEFIDIQNVDEIEEKLKGIADFSTEILECTEEDLLKGLYVSGCTGKRLVVNKNAVKIELNFEGKEGVIGVEKNSEGYVFPVIGVNYAIALGADLIVLDSLTEEETESAERRLQRWKDENNYNHFRKVYSKAKGRLAGYDLTNYRFATFFTMGLPYGLGLDNVIPVTHVHLKQRPDLFVINGIGVEQGGRFHSAVVFSPSFFKDKGGEETDEVIKVLEEKNYFVRSLVGSQATSQNLDFHVQHFPYDFLHICSHGGEMDGYEVTLSFKDRKGVNHTIEYDEAVSFTPVPGKDLIAVFQKVFFRKLNGYRWMSPQLKAQGYPQHVFNDMWTAVRNDDTPRTRSKGKIPTAYAIQTIDGFNQGAFQVLASHHHPVIFNNSCWSWGAISSFFLVAGARGYIGTLWPIRNGDAVKASEKFYEMINDYSLMTCLHHAHKEIAGTPSANIYHYWGLHFTSMSEDGVTSKDSRMRVFTMLLNSIMRWIDKVQKTKNPSIKKNSAQVVNELWHELTTNFSDEDMKNLYEKFQGMEEVDTSVNVEDENLRSTTPNEIVRYERSK